jgi:hypothetical protein
MRILCFSIVIGFLVACGSTSRDRGNGSGGVDANPNGGNCTITGMENTPAQCSDGLDNNCNGLVDCADPSCSGIGTCPICGQVQHPEGTPIDLPDGVCGTNGNGTCTCTTDADCAALQPAGQHCWTIGAGDLECRISYTSTVNFTSFGSGQQMTMPSDIVSVCVNMDHEWIRDLEIDLIAPNNVRFALDKFGGQTGGEVYWGHPTDTDGDGSTGSDVAMTYCWMPNAALQTVLGYANAGGAMQSWTGHSVEPPSAADVVGSGATAATSYAASDPWQSLVGTTLNGNWTIAVTDLWPIDAGKLHSWTITFNAAVVQNCNTPPIQ